MRKADFGDGMTILKDERGRPIVLDKDGKTKRLVPAFDVPPDELAFFEEKAGFGLGVKPDGN